MTVQELKKSFIFNASLGSKELFHSNFWAWLIDKDKSIASSIFGFNFLDLNEVQVEREVGSKNDKIDLLIKEFEHRFVIENKIKSIPNKEQLERYTEAVNRNGIFIEGVLTGIKEPHFELPNNWRFLSYSEIAENLRNYRERNNLLSPLNPYDEIVDEYIDVINSIDEHLNRRLVETESYLDFNPGDLAEIRFDDVYKKFKASEFIRYYQFIFPLGITLMPLGYEFKIKLDYNNKNSTISFEISNIVNDVTIGIQIEGRQYRYFVRTTYQTPVIENFESYVDVGWFDNEFNRYNHRTIFGQPTTMVGSQNNQFNLYQNQQKNYNFIYQYNIIQNNTYNCLVWRINDDLLRAIQCI